METVSAVKGDEQRDVTEADFVVCCNGGNSKPFQPSIIGIEKFKGRHFHSHLYRKEENLQHITKGKRVLLIGTNASAFDLITILLNSKHAAPSHLYLTGRNKVSNEYSFLDIFS